jgi:hypothetical protein
MSTVTNRNLFIQGSFKVTLNSKKYGNTTFFATSITHPGISRNETSAPYANLAGFVTGDRVEYEPVSLRIQLDEELNTYEELLDWLTNMTDRREDMTLTLMNSKNIPIREFSYKSVFPVSISSFELNTQSADAEAIAIDVSFRYDRFEFKRVVA